jgi:ribonucleoside-diphosphate reductase alpha chain
MGMRTSLPNRRAHEVLKFQHWGLSYIVGLGRADENAPVTEVFLNSGKSGEQAQTLARDSAVLLSLALQHGTPIATMQKAITRNADGTPSGPIGQLLDIIAKAQGDEGSSEGEPRIPDRPRAGSPAAEPVG